MVHIAYKSIFQPNLFQDMSSVIEMYLKIYIRNSHMQLQIIGVMNHCFDANSLIKLKF